MSNLEHSSLFVIKQLFLALDRLTRLADDHERQLSLATERSEMATQQLTSVQDQLRTVRYVHEFVLLIVNNSILIGRWFSNAAELWFYTRLLTIC